MSDLLCRMILVDHASRRPQWDALAAAAPFSVLTPLDPRPFASWDVSALAAVYQIGAGPRRLIDVIPALAGLHHAKARLCYSREQDHVLIIVEKRERTPPDVPAMLREIEPLAPAGRDLADAETPWQLPLVDTAKMAQPHRPQVQQALPPGVRTLVLVEDDPMVRSVCQRILQSRFLVFEVGGSLDALALSDRIAFPIHVLVSDITLPRMDGVTLAQRWQERRRDARVLLLSGNPYAGPTSGDISFLQKPFLADELIKCVTQLLQPAAAVAR
ncbi:MAG: response regulator [Gemmataceae bacterium]|nr:response regulator [Gemmataceae bacterium]